MRLSRAERISRSSTSRRSRRPFRRRMECERLEDRHLLAVTAQWSALTGTLTITGSTDHDSIVIGRSGILEPLVTINGSTAIPIPGAPTTIFAHDVLSLNVLGGAGDDRIDLSAVDFFGFPNLTDGQVVIHGGPGDDSITGSGFGDFLVGNQGNDVIHGGRGDDVLHGEDGIDELYGGDGNDTLQTGRIGRTVVEPPVVLETALRSGTRGTQTLHVRFSQDVTVSASALLLHDANDQPIATSEADFRYDSMALSATWTFSDGFLPREILRFTIDADAVINERGDALDGNSDGMGGDAMVGNLAWDPPALLPDTASKVISLRGHYEGNDQSRLSAIDVSFTSDVAGSLHAHDLRLHHAISHATLTPATVTWDAVTRTARWQLESTVPSAGYYVVTLDGQGIETATTHLLAGDARTPGTDLVRTIYVAPAGDLNLDGYVSEDEVLAVLGNLGMNLGGWRAGDQDGDGRVVPREALLAIDNLGVTITRFLPPAELMSGGFGDDTFLLFSPKGGQAIDIDDEGGSDTIDLSGMTHGGVQGFDLAQSAIPIPGTTAADVTLLQLLTPDAIDNVIGTSYSDSIYGNALPNRLVGNGGGDRLEGRDGPDILVGGDGNDMLLGNQGDDFLDGGDGNDWYVFDSHTSGTDTILDSEGAGDRLDFSSYPDPIHVDLRQTQAAYARYHDQFRVLLSWGQLEQVLGTPGDDILFGNDADNWLEGRDGDDLILGFGGADSLFGGAGRDSLDPGTGQDFTDPGPGFDDPEIQDQPSQVVGNFGLVYHAQAFNGSAYLATTSTSFPPTESDKVTWTFTDVAAGDYELFATWFARPSKGATNARFQVNGVFSATVNQQLPPAGPRMAGRKWQSLGEVNVASASPLVVELRTAGANGDLVADAVRLVPVGQLPNIEPVNDLVLLEEEPMLVPIRASYPLGTLEHIELTLSDDVDPGVSISNPVIDATLGIVTANVSWPPSTARETGSFLITVLATDAIHPTRYYDESFWVTFGAPNISPQLDPQRARTVAWGQPLAVTFTATDSDGPYWDLRFSLDEESPAGASIDPVSGYFTWNTSQSTTGTYSIGVIVTDDGNPPRSDRQDWSVDVVDAGVSARLAAPGSQTLPEDLPLLFSVANGNPIQILNGAAGDLALGIVAADGTVQLAPAPGIDYLVGGTQPASHILVRGSAAGLQQALHGALYVPTPNYRGHSTLRLELIDPGNAVRLPNIDTAEIPLVIAPAVDSPTIAAQTLYFRPNTNPGELDVVGTVVAHDPDPDQLLAFRIVGGNSDQAFSIDRGTGRILAAHDDVLPSGTRVLNVEAFYELSPSHSGQGTVTVHRVPDLNNSPFAIGDSYELLEHQAVTGNIVLGDVQGGAADWDPDGDTIRLFDARDAEDRPIALGAPHRLPSGATLTLQPDGSFHYDAATSQKFDRGFFGQSQDFIQYTISDVHNAKATALAMFSIDHVNDVHLVAPQTFTVDAAATNGTVVGRILVSNAEPSELFSYLLTTPGSPFVVTSDGDVVVQSINPLVKGQVFPLLVQVLDSNSTPVSANITVQVAANQPPRVEERHYVTSVDLPVIGNVLTDTAGAGIPYDPEGGPLEVVQFGGSAYDIGRSVQLASGATVKLLANGDLHYDPRTSHDYEALASNETRTERISISVRDDEGANVQAMVTIMVGARNWAPQAFDNVYSVTHRDQVTGNMVTDYGVSLHRDRDKNSDPLRLVSANGIVATDGTTFTSRAGAAVTVFSDGRFEYNPAGIDVSSFQPGDRFFDAIPYEIADGFGGRDLAVARYVITVADPHDDPFWIDQVRLVNDTATSGGTNNDLRSEDPRIAGRIAGNLGAAESFLLEFDVDARLLGGGLQPASELSMDATLLLHVNDSSFPNFAFDPSLVSGFGTFGPKTIAYRAQAFDASNTVVSVSVWEYFSFEWLQPRHEGPVRIDEIRLFHDTATIDGDGQIVGHDDGITTDPRIFGVVSGNFSHPPLVGNDLREVHIAFEHQRDGTTFADSMVVSAVNTFLYDPRQVDPELASMYSGPLAVHYSADLVERIGGNITTTPLAVGTIQFTLLSVPASCGLVILEEGPSPVGGYLGSSRELLGQAVWNSGCEPAGSPTFVEFDFASSAGTFDEIVDDHTVVVVDGGAQPPSAVFEYTAVGLPGVAPRLRARIREWSPANGAFLYSIWSPPLQLSAATSPGIAFFEVDYQTFQLRDIPHVRGHLVGSIDDNTSGVPYHLGAVGFIDVQVFHRNPSDFVFSSAWPVDGTTMTDAFGRFDYVPTGLTYGQDYRIWARTMRTLSDGSEVFGIPVTPFELVNMEGPRFPLVTSLDLFNPAVATNVNGRWRTSDTRMMGSLERQTGGVEVHDVQLEFAHDYLNVTGDENTVVGIASVDMDGSFRYSPILSNGDVNIRARMSFYDEISATRMNTDWHATEVRLTVEAPVHVPTSVKDLRLANPTEPPTTPPRTFDPTVRGHVLNPDGYVGFVSVEFRNANTLAPLGSTQTDSTGEFQFTLSGLTAGTNRISARAYDWDYSSQQLVPGPWTSGVDNLEFIFEVMTPFEVASFGLLSDTGPIPGHTANPALVGTVQGGGSPSDVKVAIDHGDDGTYEALVTVDASGEFMYVPIALPLGTHPFRARVATWNVNQGSFQYSPGRLTTFVLESQPNLPAQFAEIGLAHPPVGNQPVQDATIVGRVTNERYLEGITIEFDFDNDDQNGFHQSVTTDAAGRFLLQPTLLATGPANIRARTRELDDTGTAFLVSNWFHLPTFNYQPTSNQPPTITLTLVNASGGSPPVTPDGRVAGVVSNQEPMDQVIVEFAWTENGSVLGTAVVDALGNFQFEPPGLLTGETYTLWARAREAVGAPGPSYQYSPPVSVTFLFQSSVPTDLHIASFSLVNDTATPGGSTNTDGSTSDATLGGIVAWSTGTIAGLTVEIDVDRDFQPDATVLTDVNGDFVFPFDPDEAGFYSVVARVRYPSFGTSDWKRVNFVYDTNDSSPQALALVNALSVIDANWQTSDDLDFSAIEDLAQMIFTLGSQRAQSDYEYAMALAEVMKSVVIHSVSHQYHQAQSAAEHALQQAVSAAQQQFLVALMALPADQRRTYNLTDFPWPADPLDNALVIPSDAHQAAAPPAPSYDGPSFQPQYDPSYQQVVWNVGQLFLIATRNAEQSYTQQRQIVEQQFESDTNAAKSRHRQAMRQASEQFDTDRADRPRLKDTEYQDKLDELDDIWDTYRDAWIAAGEIWHAKAQAALEQRDQAYQNAWEAYDAAVGNCPGSFPTIAEYNACATRRYNATLDLDAKFRQISAKYQRAMAEFNHEHDTQVAYVWKSARLAAIPIERAIARIVRQHYHDLFADGLDDQSRLIKSQAQANADLASDLAQADATRAKALADLAYQRDEQIALARRQRDQVLASQYLAAVQHWSLVVATPWSLYQADVAVHHNTYQQAIVGLAFDRDMAIASAVRQEAYAVANAERSRADTETEAEETRTIELDTLTHDYRIDVDAQHMEQHLGIREAWAEYETTTTEARADFLLASADVLKTYRLAIADADEANYQPPDLVHARCPTFGCGVWEFFVVIDNSGVRARNWETHRRRVSEAERDRVIGLTDANEAFHDVRIDATESYRIASDTQIRDTTKQVAELRFEYEVDVAIEQDRFSLTIATAAADYAVAIASGESGRALREVLANETYAVGAVHLRRTLDIATATRTQTFQVGLANLYLTQVVGWSASHPGPWSQFRINLAVAELARVVAVQASTFAQTVYASQITVARILADSNANRAFAETILSSTGAYRDNVTTISQAAIELAKASHLEDFVRRQATAVKVHDQKVADATLTYRLSVIDSEAERDRKMNAAQSDRIRALERARHAKVLDPEGTSWEELRNEAYLTYFRIAARANSALVLARESARHVWKHTVNDLNVQQVRDIVATQVARADTIRDEAIIMANASAKATRNYVAAEATASLQQQRARTVAEATEQVRSAELAALHASHLVAADGQHQVAVAVARATYENTLHNFHRLTTLAYSQVTGTTYAAYFSQVAALDHELSIAMGNAAVAYQQSFAQLLQYRQAAMNAIQLSSIDHTSGANIALANLQTTADRSLASAIANQMSQLHIRKETARAELTVAGTAKMGQADIEYAEAASDRNKAFADAEFEFVQVITPARADLEVACGRFWWFWFFGCGSEQAAYQAIYDEAFDAYEQAREEATDTFRLAVRSIELREETDLADERMAYVEAIGDAKLDYAQRQAQLFSNHAVASALHRNQYTRSVASASYLQDTRISELEYDFAVGSGNMKIALEQQKAVARSTYSVGRANSDASYFASVATSEASQWQSLANANPADLYIQFLAAQGTARSVWAAAMKPAFVTYRATNQSAQSAAQVHLVTQHGQYTADLAFSDWFYTQQIGLANRDHILTVAMVDSHDSVHRVSNEQALTIGATEAETAHALVHAAADARYRVALDQIELRYQQNQDGEERLRSRREALYAKKVALAKADNSWQHRMADVERSFGKDEATREFQKSVKTIFADRQFAIQSAAADRSRQFMVATVTAAWWRAESDITALQSSLAAANASLMSANYTANISAMSEFASMLTIPWGDFQFQRAVARNSAWVNSRSQFLAMHQSFTAAEQAFLTARTDAYVTAARNRAVADESYAVQHAIVTATSAVAAANVQRGFAQGLAAEAADYRKQLGRANRDYAIALAKAERDGQDPSGAHQQYQADKLAAEQSYRNRYSQWNRERRERLGMLGFELVATTAAMDMQRATQHVQAEFLFSTALMAAYFAPGGSAGLEGILAAAYHAYISHESSALTGAMASVPSSPWANLAAAEATARTSILIHPLAELQRVHRATLATVRKDYHAAVMLASLTQFQMLTQWGTTASTLQAAGQLALVATFLDGELPLPKSVIPPTPDLGDVERLTGALSTNFPSVVDIDYYGHPGSYNYWGSNYWGTGFYLDVYWHWSLYGYYDYGWGYGNYSWYYGYGPGYWNSYWGGYYGYWSYSPWYFSWYGWSGAYVSAPRGLAGAYSVDVPKAQASVGETLNDLMDPVHETSTTLSIPEDDDGPILDAATGTITLVNGSATFSAAAVQDSRATTQLDDFTDAAPTADVTTRSVELIAVARSITISASNPNAAKPKDWYEFTKQFKVSTIGNAVYVREAKLEGTIEFYGKDAYPQFRLHTVGKQVIGFLGPEAWVQFGGVVGHGRAQWSALVKATRQWNSSSMEQVLRSVHNVGGNVNTETPQLQQLVDGIRSPHQISPGSDTIGIFIGGTDMHFYGVGNVEKMYNMYLGAKFYHGGVGNRVDSRHPILESAMARTEFDAIIRRAMRDVLDHGAGKRIQIFGWSRGAAQAAELARRLEAKGMTVEFVGLFDPVYSVGSAGQGSRYIESNAETRDGNYVKRKLAKNVEQAAIIYAMNEVRTWFPATIFEKEPGASTIVQRISSPGAHGEVGGHWGSNLWVQQLNLHQMIAMVPGNGTLFYHDIGGMIPEVASIYESNYTVYLALKDSASNAHSEALAALSDSLANALWRNLSTTEYTRQANSRDERHWNPGRLETQANTPISNWTDKNTLALIEPLKYTPGHPWVNANSLELRRHLVQPINDFSVRRIHQFMTRGPWSLYPGISKDLFEQIYRRTINPHVGGWRG